MCVVNVNGVICKRVKVIVSDSTVSNHKFLLNVVRSKLYQIRIMNDLSCDMLTGSQIKSLLESDLQAGNITNENVFTHESWFAYGVLSYICK